MYGNVAIVGTNRLGSDLVKTMIHGVEFVGVAGVL